MRDVFKNSWHDHGSLIVVVFLYCVAVCAVGVGMGVPPHEFLAAVNYGAMAVLIALVFWTLCFVFAYIRAVGTALFVRRGRDGTLKQHIASLFDCYTRAHTTPSALMDAGLAVIAIVGLSLFFAGKALVPLIGNYTWDPLFIDIEIIMHGGRTPMEWLAPVIDRAGIVRFLDRAYLFWFPVMFGVTSWVTFCERNRTRRLQYLWVYCLSWMVIGTVMAIALASVGPIYVHDFYPDLATPYTAPLAALRTIDAVEPLRALQIAALLHDMGQNESMLDLNTISAMPSMHVSIAWLIVLYALSARHWAGIAAAVAFWGVILAGSIILGWHYAIDGYVGMVAMTAIWGVAGMALRHKTGQKAGALPTTPLDRAALP